jgi:hypothetical protein
MKPDWRTAPSWANYLAMDENGELWWYEKEPGISEESWVVNYGRVEKAGYSAWRDSLQERPKETDEEEGK